MTHSFPKKRHNRSRAPASPADDGPSYQRLLDNLSTATLLVTEQGRVRYLNPAAEALLKASAQRVIGQPLASLFSDADEEEGLLTLPDIVITERQPFTRRQARLILPSGHGITVDYQLTPLEDGSAIIIELHPLDRLLRISREERLVAAQKTSRILIRGLAHEIKNPLGGIRGAAQLLDKELPDPRLRDYTHIIIEEADRLRNLVDRLLGPVRPSAFRPLNIHEVLEHVRTLVQAEAGSDVRIERDYDPSIPELTADREQLIQAILNITRNALQALTGRGDGRILLRTRVLRQFTIGRHRHPLVCRIDIEDNGPGIDPEVRDRIFFPMVTGRAEGTGLGLSLAQSVVQHHQGLIECQSEPGRTVFILYLPLEQQYDPAE